MCLVLTKRTQTGRLFTLQLPRSEFDGEGIWKMYFAEALGCLSEGPNHPELSPYFDSKLYARLREAQAEAPEGFIERVRSFFLFSTGRSFRPALTAALAAVLVVGGGSTFVGLHNFAGTPPQALLEMTCLLLQQRYLSRYRCAKEN